MTLKAIDTHYNGYKFRSRLEARWAVFFDALGIKYEYEKEGYDLGDGLYYLPDFYLPESNEFVEIKPLNKYTPPKAWYFAGKFTGAKNIPESYVIDWREEIFNINGNTSNIQENEGYYLINGDFYIGPFYRDHSCTHGSDGGHVLETAWYVNYHDNSSFNESGVKNLKHYTETLNKSLKQIENCDIFFAYLFSNDCYGTLAEIGYAKALGKTIYICVTDEVKKDLWFSILCADKVFTEDIEQTVSNLFWLDDAGNVNELFKLGNLCKYKKNIGILCYGDPLDNTQIIVNGYTARPYQFITYPKTKSLIKVANNSKEYQAAQKARSARFEHGENP